MQANRQTWQSFDEMRKAAEEGDAAAQCYLGICYQTGQGVTQDYQQALSGSAGPPNRTTRPRSVTWAYCYQSGLGVPQEYGQAAKWFREAAEQGDPAAQFNLGVLYETGQGVPQNYAEAVKWYHAAAEQGEPQAQFNLGVFYETGQVVPQNYEEAVKWYRALRGAGMRPGPMQPRPLLRDRTRRAEERARGRQMVLPRRARRRQDRAAQPGRLLRDARSGRGGHGARRNARRRE